MGPHAGNRSRPPYSGQARFQFPKQVIQLFKPRPPLEFRTPIRKRRLRPITGLSQFVEIAFDRKKMEKNEQEDKTVGKKKQEHGSENGQVFDDSGDENHSRDKVSGSHVGNKDDSSGKGKVETGVQVYGFEIPGRRRKRKREERRRIVKESIERRRNSYVKYNGEGDAWKTVFVGGLAPETTEKVLWWEMENYGRVVRVIIPLRKNKRNGVEGEEEEEGLSVGYGFVEYASAKEAERAWREGNGKRIDGRRVLVDVERGRTVKGWLPNRLDGPRNVHVRRNSMPPAAINTRGGGEERDESRRRNQAPLGRGPYDRGR